MANTSSLFSQQGLVQWWSPKYLTQAFNNRNELGMDFGLPLSTPVASISAGRVVYAQPMQSNPGSSVGYIVQVQNADGSLFHYQHLRSANVHVGDYVRVGDVLGFSGGCPANGYGQTGCRYTDQYTTGPHIEVRYSPTYFPSQGAWGQDWQNPAQAFQAYSGQTVTQFGGAGNIANLLTGQVNSGGLLNIALDPTNLSSGISNGLGGVVQKFTGAATDAGIRAFLLVGGFIAAALGLFMLSTSTINDNEKVKEVKSGAAQGAGAAIGGEAGSQAAKAIIPPVGDRKRRQAIVREERKAALPAVPAPKQQAPALPAPSGQKALPPGDISYEQLLEEQKKARDRAQMQGAFTPAAENKSLAKVLGIAAAPKPDADAKVSEIKPPDLPLPKEAEAGAQRRQVNNRIKRDEREKMRRIERNIRRRKR